MRVELNEIKNYDVAVLVAGSRTYQDRREFAQLLEESLNSMEVLEGKNVVYISGTASGPDKMIIEWCKKHGKDWVEMPAKWDELEGVEARFIKVNSRGEKYNVAAGHQRNEEMAKITNVAVIFYDGVSMGTSNMMKLLNERSIPFNLIMVKKTYAK